MLCRALGWNTIAGQVKRKEILVHLQEQQGGFYYLINSQQWNNCLWRGNLTPDPNYKTRHQTCAWLVKGHRSFPAKPEQTANTDCWCQHKNHISIVGALRDSMSYMAEAPEREEFSIPTVESVGEITPNQHEGLIHQSGFRLYNSQLCKLYIACIPTTLSGTVLTRLNLHPLSLFSVQSLVLNKA